MAEQATHAGGVRPGDRIAFTLGTDAVGRPVAVARLGDVEGARWVLDDDGALWIAFRLARCGGRRLVRVSHLTREGEDAALRFGP